MSASDSFQVIEEALRERPLDNYDHDPMCAYLSDPIRRECNCGRARILAALTVLASLREEWERKEEVWAQRHLDEQRAAMRLVEKAEAERDEARELLGEDAGAEWFNLKAENQRLREALLIWENGLARAYQDHREYQTAIATLCDLYLDHRGGLLGRVRAGPVSYDTAVAARRALGEGS